MKARTAILATLLVAATACSHAGADDPFRWTSELPPGATVHFRNASGEIRVRPASSQSVVVNGSRRWRRGRANDVQFEVTHNGNDYYVCAMWRGSGNCSKNYRGNTGGGFLSMFSLFHRTSDATAGIVAEVPPNVFVDATLSNGTVHVDGMSAGVRALTANGNVEAMNVSGPLSLETVNGDVRLSADASSPSDPINVSTKNGTIRAELPSNAEGNFDLSVGNGTLRSDFPLSQMAKARIGRHLQGQIGSSTRVVKMRSVNGGVFVTTRPAATSHE
jgi:hypothetical protein